MSKLSSIFFFLLLSLAVLILAVFWGKWDSSAFGITEREKCPACFGVSMCQSFRDDEINFQYDDFASTFNNFLSVKNVFYGTYKGKKVVMKKLAGRSELDSFDKEICQDSKLFELCPKKSAAERKTDFRKLISTDLKNSDFLDPNSKVRFCPSIERFDELIENVNTENRENLDFYKFIWTSLRINPEPIILQVLSAENNWPTPKYFGACGRIIVEQYVGPPLLTFTDESWITRATIASSLLDAAFKFTFKHPKFAFYLTDISLDNIAVDSKKNAVFVDLENVIVVDRNPLPKVSDQKTWNKVHISLDFDDCQDCFTFSPSDICSHKISDHNYYAVCQHILAQGFSTTANIDGLLHDPPEHILDEYPNLMDFLQQCSKPKDSDSRIDAGIQLKNTLDTIIISKKL